MDTFTLKLVHVLRNVRRNETEECTAGGEQSLAMRPQSDRTERSGRSQRIVRSETHNEGGATLIQGSGVLSTIVPAMQRGGTTRDRNHESDTAAPGNLGPAPRRSTSGHNDGPHPGNPYNGISTGRPAPRAETEDHGPLTFDWKPLHGLRQERRNHRQKSANGGAHTAGTNQDRRPTRPTGTHIQGGTEHKESRVNSHIGTSSTWTRTRHSML